jgi:hypothetical protein
MAKEKNKTEDKKKKGIFGGFGSSKKKENSKEESSNDSVPKDNQYQSHQTYDSQYPYKGKRIVFLL